jgi:type II secretory pathway component PulJ
MTHFLSAPPCLRGERRPGGFTLIELLVSAAIAMVIFAIGFVILNGATQARSETQARIQATDYARMFFNMLERDLAGAYPGPWTDPYSKADLVYTPAGASGNAIEMTTTSEHPNPGQEIVSVRYYVLGATKRLYREVSTTQPSASAPIGDPLSPTALSTSNDFALLPNVETLTAQFYKWDEALKGWAPATAPAYSDATHLNVRMDFRDPNEKQPNRSFQKLIPLPIVFRN